MNSNIIPITIQQKKQRKKSCIVTKAIVVIGYEELAEAIQYKTPIHMHV